MTNNSQNKVDPETLREILRGLTEEAAAGAQRSAAGFTEASSHDRKNSDREESIREVFEPPSLISRTANQMMQKIVGFIVALALFAHLYYTHHSSSQLPARGSSLETWLVEQLNSQGFPNEWASAALEALDGEANLSRETLLSYAILSGQLASIAKAQGSEASICRGIFGVLSGLRADVNDSTQIQDVADAVRRIFNVTNVVPSVSLGSMTETLKHTPGDLRRSMGLSGLVGLETAEIVAGPKARAFVSAYLSDADLRERMDRMGFEGVIGGPSGLDAARFERFIQEVGKVHPI